jgi:hypothetical protein
MPPTKRTRRPERRRRGSTFAFLCASDQPSRALRQLEPERHALDSY